MEIGLPIKAMHGFNERDRKSHDEEPLLPASLFRQLNLIDVRVHTRELDRENLTNIINHIHFTDQCMMAWLFDPRYEESIIVRIVPEPCLSEELTCHWCDDNFEHLKLDQYRFQYLAIDDGKSLILSPSKAIEINRDRISLRLSEKSYHISQRENTRYRCNNVIAEVSQNGFFAEGEMVDFNPAGFRIVVNPDPHSSFRWLNTDEPVNICLKKSQQVVFSGRCRYIRRKCLNQSMEIVLSPVNDRIQRYKKKQPRTIRLEILPSPNLVFDHPILDKRIELKCRDMSTSGFLVYEEPDESVLMPGMVIPRLNIQFPGTLKIICTAQVIYCIRESDKVRCGVAILDMDINSYSSLTQILCNIIEPDSYIANELDMDALWEFFFETGFIYPKKYRLIQSHRNSFKETYRKLYQENPEIAKHFTYQINGKVFGHISMLRAYERTWMVQHHAAKGIGNKRTGFIVLKQFINYINDMYRLPSAKMDYLMAYFRPENRFPERVFGGFEKAINDKNGCSTDIFAYLPHTRLSIDSNLPEGWILIKSSPMDIWNLKRHYKHISGGLLIDAIGIGQQTNGTEPLEKIYARLGFKRKSDSYALLKNGDLHAVFIMNQSDLGINLSELLSGITVIVVKSADLPWNVLSVAISKLTREFEITRVPVLFSPVEYVRANDVPFEKLYTLWVLNVQYGNEYMEYMHERFRMNYFKKN
ncbi:MAG: PilZ domain-containing protein [Deltaproteobacteria bacterium]|nr:PilZ domain-containing protein [Deltaproteobacteria bacterium]